MTIANDQLADKVVIAFKNILSEESKSQLSDKEFHELNLIVREALSQQISQTADMVDDISKQLRSMTDHQDIGL
ncbi:MAG: hypothetical protein GQ475_05765 [Methylococcaceae bacterium]|nr:hypothetical protein [Methylococcaceae bacterium]